MSIAARIRSKLSDQQSPQQVTGQWRSISLCLDEDAGEFFNVGVLFVHEQKVEVRMLDSFERLRCLFDARVNPNDLARLLDDIESTIYHMGADLPNELGDTIRLGPPLYAAGVSAESVVDEFFADVVTLARPRPGAHQFSFRYQSTPRIRSNVFDLMKERMHMQASRIIQEERYMLTMRSGHRVELDIPLLSASAAGTVVSGWYKSPLVVENNLLQASADLNLIRSNSKRIASISVLVPGKDSGLSAREFNKLDSATQRQLDRIRLTGIEVLDAATTAELADKTIGWWRERCA